MKQADFEKKYQYFWLELEDKLNIKLKAYSASTAQAGKPAVAAKKPLKTKVNRLDLNIDLGEQFPENYRLLCHHLSLARTRHYSPLLVDRLEKLVIHTHQLFYRRKTHLLVSVLVYFTAGFAQSVRKQWRWVLLSGVLFSGSFFAMLISLQYYPDMIYTVMSGGQIAQLESMYDPQAVTIGRERNSGTDFQMFGYYIFNNTGIGLKTFASGLLFGIGTIFTLLFNGVYIGSAAGYLTFIDYGSTFWPFVSSHSAMELSAIVLSGAAGFMLGFSIISPGRKSRLRALRDSAVEAVYMMYGVATMFLIAAFIEAYWSSMSDIPATVKYAVGIVGWLLLIAYFVFAGRRNAAR
ncbi:hypothetical protein MNBD_GAMMA10-1236 [hydrothermal vent metagenome]|uniref:Stage II sporulation protein M n=1 Tax=hydrothermal vent metagenome TaxID=652676 RepID=A0A3B0XF63_9ZZZZ